jgi:hypothetical protein
LVGIVSTTSRDLRRRADELFARQNADTWRTTLLPGEEVLAEVPTYAGEVLLITRYFQTPARRHAKIAFRVCKLGPRGERYRGPSLNFKSPILPALAEGIARAMDAELEALAPWADHDNDH